MEAFVRGYRHVTSPNEIAGTLNAPLQSYIVGPAIRRCPPMNPTPVGHMKVLYTVYPANLRLIIV